MKINIIIFTSIVFLIGVIPLSCDFTSKEDAKVTKENTQEIEMAEKVNWEEFNKNSQASIKDSNIQIENLRREISEVSKKDQKKFNSVLDKLEQKNDSLKQRLAQINKQINEDLEQIDQSQEDVKKSFEESFVQDINEILDGLRDFWKNK